jgi:RimJ/RimL family protein N-acetyltransferase
MAQMRMRRPRRDTGLSTLRAATSRENAASQKVLTKAGFVPAGSADPADLGGKEGSWYQRNLAAPAPSSTCANP